MKQKVQAIGFIDIDEMEEREARWAETAGLDQKLDEFLQKKEEVNAKDLLIEAYEAVNTVERVNERELLN